MKNYDKTKTEKLVDECDDIIWTLNQRNDILPVKRKGKNVIKVIIDTSCEMAEVSLNGECLMMGNFWDFHPGCHGGVLRVLGYLMGTPD